MAATGVGPPAAGGSESTRDHVGSEFHLEDVEVLLPLTTRMGEIADRLDRGEPVDPPYIAEGIELWGRYVRELHARRLERVVGLFPATSPAGVREAERRGRGGWRAGRAKVKEPEGVTPAKEFQEILHDQALMAERVSELRSLLEFYKEERYGARERLASVLKAFAFSDRAWASYEDDFVVKSLDRHLQPDLDRLVRDALEEVSAARRKLQAAVEAFVARPIPVREASGTTPAPSPAVSPRT